jgi:glycosyltransferase involved in cell wall biosynthesis
MDIITVCRTLNEERNIERFCEEYSKISDAILIVDGGSEDKTVEMAMSYNKVLVTGFYDRVYRDNIWRNPHGLHLNLMFEWAEKMGAAWIIYDDCDSLPNHHLKDNIYIPFANEDCYMVGVKRLYLYKDEG